MSVVSLPEFRNYMSGIHMTPAQSLDAQAILDGVQSELEDYINRPLQEQRVQESVEADYAGRAFMRLTPIVAVYGIYEQRADGSTGPLIEVVNLARNWFSKNRNYLLVPSASCVIVDYLGGLNADLHPGVKAAIKRVAAREYAHKHGDGMSIQNTELRVPEDPTPTPKGWGEDELKKFDRLRRRTVV